MYRAEVSPCLQFKVSIIQGGKVNVSVCNYVCREKEKDKKNIVFSYDYIGEGNGTPLQYSCLENPMDWRSLVGCSPWGRTELDMTEVT